MLLVLGCGSYGFWMFYVVVQTESFALFLGVGWYGLHFWSLVLLSVIAQRLICSEICSSLVVRLQLQFSAAGLYDCMIAADLVGCGICCVFGCQRVPSRPLVAWRCGLRWNESIVLELLVVSLVLLGLDCSSCGVGLLFAVIILELY